MTNIEQQPELKTEMNTATIPMHSRLGMRTPICLV